MKVHERRSQLIGVLADPKVADSFDNAQWSALIASARSSNLLGALAECVFCRGIANNQFANRHLEGAKQLSARQRQSVFWEVHQLQATLGKLRIPVLLLKGAAYVMSNREVAKGRLFGDVDILVPRDALDDVESQLMLNGWVSAKTSDYDQRYYRKWMHEIPPMMHVRRGTVIDVHHTILPLTGRNSPDPMQIIARSTPIGLNDLDAIRVPCPEDLVIHSITHLVHESELHNGLRDLRDIDCMTRDFSKDPAFWTRLARFASGNDLAQPVLLGLQLAKMVFATPVPNTVTAQLMANGHAVLPAGWLMSAFDKALEPAHCDGSDLRASFAKWLLYVRAHSLRMPLPLLSRHLAVKAWMGLQEKFGPTPK